MMITPILLIILSTGALGFSLGGAYGRKIRMADLSLIFWISVCMILVGISFIFGK